MIDELRQVNRLLVKLEENLPIVASLTPQAAEILKGEASGADFSQRCQVTAVHYLGDEGGIVCRLDQGEGGRPSIVTSITHLTFDRKQPCAREIAAYQKNRIARQRRVAT
ncbi:MAG: hypothetical protein R3D62_10215 [Xanthobacteraceae bacterium]